MKKIISALMLTTMCISTLLPAPVMAQENVAFEVSISAVNEVGAVGANAEQSNAGKKFTANVTVNSGADMIDHFTYQWGRDWTPIKNETNQTYIPGNDYLNYINQRVFVKAFDADGNQLGSQVMACHDLQAFGRMSKRKVSNSSVSTPTSDTNAYPKQEGYTFELDGKSFTVLDDFSSETETYYVLANDSYGKRVFDTGITDYGTVLFKSSEGTMSSGTGNIAYWLNNDFLTNGNGSYKLPDAIIDNLSEHKYAVAQNQNYQQNEEILKVSLLGRADYYKYIDKFYPIVGNNTSNYWWLRDVQGIVTGGNGKLGPFVVMPNWNSVEGINNTATECHIRPAFYLGKDFFTTVKLDTEKMGYSVKALLAERYTESELGAIYSEDELDAIYSRTPLPYKITNFVIDETDGLTVKFDMTAKTAPETGRSAFTAVYNRGKLCGISMLNAEIEVGTTKKQTIAFDDIDAYDDVRIFCWDMPSQMPQGSPVGISDAIIIHKYIPPSETVSEAEFVLPDTIYGTVGKEMNVYFENVIFCDDIENYQIDVDCTKGVQQSERWTYTPTAAESFTLTVKVLKNHKDVINSKTVSVKVLSAPDDNRNILFLGDTWIDEAQVVSYVKDNFNGADVNFIGTKSKANYPDIKFEGMKNFTTKNFVENSNGFDFGGYLQNNSLTAPDTVVLFMGSNDVSANIESDVTVENIRAVINAIHSYNSNIKIKVCTVPNPADTDEAALRKFKVMRLNRKLLAAFDDMIANVSIAEVHAGVDSAYSFEILEETHTNGSIVYRYADVIYPAAAGYHQCADIIYAGL